MRLVATPLAGAFILETDRHTDARGFFARVWCRQEFEVAGLPATFLQASISHNLKAGTVRGLHFAWPPAREDKLVRCERGAIFDVIVDLRPGSPSFLEHFTVELDADRANELYVPRGFAHGFQTLLDNTTVGYAMTEAYVPALAGGFRHDDPAFRIAWPRAISMIVERDRTYPDFQVDSYLARCAAAPALA